MNWREAAEYSLRNTNSSTANNSQSAGVSRKPGYVNVSAPEAMIHCRMCASANTFAFDGVVPSLKIGPSVV